VGGRSPIAVPRREVARIIQSRMDEILGMVRDVVQDRGYLAQLGGGVVLTGGGALLGGVVELAQDVFGLPARIGYPNRYGGLVEEYRSPTYATAVGLVAHAVERERVVPSETASPARRTRAASKKESAGPVEKLKQWFREFF
jgi:cell division protein FtsA